MKAYLEFEDLGRGMFDNERALKVIDYWGNEMFGLFYNGLIKDSRLEATIFEIGKDYVDVYSPNEGFFECGGIVRVKRERCLVK